MDTRSTADLKKALETLEADKREMAQQLKAMQDQITELSLAGRRRREERTSEDSDNDRESVNNRRNEQRTWHSIDIKVDIPEYDGRLDPDEFVEWMRTVERVFDYKNKVKIVALKLRKYASTWWANTCSKREKMGKEKVRTWQKMKKLLKQKFLPSYHLQASFSELHSLKQSSRSAEEYSRDFEHLIMKCDLPEDDPQTLVRYLGGLEPRIAHVVELQPYSSLEELTILAHKVDTQQKAKAKNEVSRSFSKPSSNTKPISASKPTIPFVPNPNSTLETHPTSSRTPRRCFRCQGLGHIASECTNKKIVTLADFENSGKVYFDGMEDDDEVSAQDDVNVLGPDEGECLVVRRTLNSTTVPKENLQREAIFHTRCTVAQKVCLLIIDGGSCTNVASQTMVTKLNLATESHPFPYVIQWLNQGKGIHVSHRVLLSFSIGNKYNDQLWCDVLPMDACHVLLGRPWLFDRRVLHDGYKNTYAFTHHSHKIVLTPISPKTTRDERPFPISTLIKSELHEFAPARELILLGLDDDDEEASTDTQHPMVQPLLETFDQVFPKDIPSGLPPLRDIQHKIDLIQHYISKYYLKYK